MNNIVVMGRITKDPEIKKYGDNKKMLVFSVADNITSENTNFFDCIAYGKTAKFISEYFKKGDPIYVSGSVNIKVTKKNDKVYTNVNINVYNASFTVSKKAENDNKDEIEEDNLW